MIASRQRRRRSVARSVAALLALALALAAAACDGLPFGLGPDESPTPEPTAAPTADPTPEPTPPPPACWLLTETDIEAAIGRPVVAVEPTEVPGLEATGCRWTIEPPEAPPLAGQVHLDIERAGGLEAWEDIRAAVGGDAEPVEGIGDNAFWGAAGTLFIVSGDVLVSIQVIDQAADRSAVALALAPIVVRRL